MPSEAGLGTWRGGMISKTGLAQCIHNKELLTYVLATATKVLGKRSTEVFSLLLVGQLGQSDRFNHSALEKRRRLGKSRESEHICGTSGLSESENFLLIAKLLLVQKFRGNN